MRLVSVFVLAGHVHYHYHADNVSSSLKTAILPLATLSSLFNVHSYLYIPVLVLQLSDEDDCSPLYYAVLNENPNLVEYLLQMVSKPNLLLNYC